MLSTDAVAPAERTRPREALRLEDPEEFVWANCMVISRAFNMAEPRDSMNHSLEKHNVMCVPNCGLRYLIPLGRCGRRGDVAKYHDAAQGAVADELRRFVMYGFSDLGTFSA